MVFGGSMHPDQDEHFGWLEQEEKILQHALAENVPVLGVCLGAQMLARAAGARVWPASAPEVGWLGVELTRGRTGGSRARRAAAEVRAPSSGTTTRSRSRAAPTELARSDVCTQAFRAGERAWGIQFHAEVTFDMVHAWTAEDPDDLPAPADDFLAATRARIDGWNEHGRELCGAFLDAAAR